MLSIEDGQHDLATSLHVAGGDACGMAPPPLSSQGASDGTPCESFTFPGTGKDDCPAHTASGPVFHLLGVPESGARSRTEIQIKLSLRITSLHGAGAIKSIILPAHQLLHPKARHQRSAQPSPSAVQCAEQHASIHMRASVIYSDRAEAVYSCSACSHREAKRALCKRPRGPQEASSSEEDEASEERSEESYRGKRSGREVAVSRERILVFAGASERIPIIDGSAALPLRITCYCRHHGERTGFRVKMEFFSHLHVPLGAALSPPIFITDDHKRIYRRSATIAAQMGAATRAAMLMGPMGLSLPPSPPESPHHLLPSSMWKGLDPLMAFMAFDEDVLPAATKATPAALPAVTRVCPSEGPMHGGIEVTVIGRHFTPESGITFGLLACSTVSFVNDCTLIVRLPPSLVAGMVSVAVAGRGGGDLELPAVTFEYKNNLDKAMMELALQLIGMKMTGRVDDARDIAIRIINEFTMHTNGGGVAPCIASALCLSTENKPDWTRLERTLIMCLATGSRPLTEEDVASIRTPGGQTLLHLAAIASLDNLFEYLCSAGHGRLLAERDHNGFIPTDLCLYGGSRDLLQRLGLDDCTLDDGAVLDGPTSECWRLALIQKRSVRRLGKQPVSTMSLLSLALLRLPRRPSAIGRVFTRLGGQAWRRMLGEAGIKAYYLGKYGVEDVHPTPADLLYTSYRENAPFTGRARDLMILYCWIPIPLAAVFLWCYANLSCAAIRLSTLLAIPPTLNIPIVAGP